MPPPPAPSPRSPPEFAEEPTGLYPATRDFAREVARSGLFKVAVGVGSFAVLCLVAGVTAARAMAQEAKDAGVEAAKGHEYRLTTLEAQRKTDRDEMNSRLQRLEDTQNADHALTLGTSQKLDVLLERMRVPNPAPTPKDGGP